MPGAARALGALGALGATGELTGSGVGPVGASGELPTPPGTGFGTAVPGRALPGGVARAGLPGTGSGVPGAGKVSTGWAVAGASGAGSVLLGGSGTMGGWARASAAQPIRHAPSKTNPVVTEFGFICSPFLPRTGTVLPARLQADSSLSTRRNRGRSDLSPPDKERHYTVRNDPVKSGSLRRECKGEA